MKGVVEGMDLYSSQISRLIAELADLPGIGAKTAQRLAFHILNMPEEKAKGFIQLLKMPLTSSSLPKKLLKAANKKHG